MAAKHDQSKTRQESSVANTTNNVTKTITDSMNTTLNYVTNVTNPQGGNAGSTSMLPLLSVAGLGLIMVLALVLRR